MHSLPMIQHLNKEVVDKYEARTGRNVPIVHSWTLYVANADAQTLAVLAQEHDLVGTVHPKAFGFSEWGVEPTVVVEVSNATRRQVQRFTAEVFEYQVPSEEAIFVRRGNDTGETWYRDGSSRALLDHPALIDPDIAA